MALSMCLIIMSANHELVYWCMRTMNSDFIPLRSTWNSGKPRTHEKYMKDVTQALCRYICLVLND